jgi:hypothetical protein
MDCRNREVTEKLWGDYSGCFEVPSLDKKPSKVHNSQLLTEDKVNIGEYFTKS